MYSIHVVWLGCDILGHVFPRSLTAGTTVTTAFIYFLGKTMVAGVATAFGSHRVGRFMCCHNDLPDFCNHCRILTKVLCLLMSCISPVLSMRRDGKMLLHACSKMLLHACSVQGLPEMWSRSDHIGFVIEGNSITAMINGEPRIDESSSSESVKFLHIMPLLHRMDPAKGPCIGGGELIIVLELQDWQDAKKHTSLIEIDQKCCKTKVEAAMAKHGITCTKAKMLTVEKGMQSRVSARKHLLLVPRWSASSVEARIRSFHHFSLNRSVVG